MVITFEFVRTRDSLCDNLFYHRPAGHPQTANRGSWYVLTLQGTILSLVLNIHAFPFRWHPRFVDQ